MLPSARRPRPSHPLPDALLALVIALAVGGVSWILAAPVPARQSPAPHFVLQADALLHGRLWIDPQRGTSLGDVTPAAGRLYVAFPPLPALLMLPFVAAAGPGFNDARFSLVLGALNAALVYLLVRRLGAPAPGRPAVPLGRTEAVAVAAVFALGTVHASAAPIGRVWFTAHVVTVTALLLYLLESAGRGRPLVAGGAMALAVLTRPTVVLGSLFWLLLAGRGAPGPRRRSRLLRFALPVAAAGAVLLLLNAARFGSPLDFGYLGMRVAPALAPDLQTYGQFSPHFLARNLGALLAAPPAVDGPGLLAWLRAADGPAQLGRRLATPGAWRELVRFDPWGTGLWAVSPVLLLAVRRPRRADAPWPPPPA